jgi:hypothetical protein
MLERFHELKIIVDEITCNPQIIEGIKKSHSDKIRKINFKQDDWECITILINLLKPFYKATIMLQGQKYHSISISKVIETSLTKYYEQLFEISNSFLESTVSSKLSEYVNKYLVDKISVTQKELTSVNYLRNYFERNVLLFILKVAAYLDPATHGYLNDAEMKKAENYCKKEYPSTGNTPDKYYVEDDSRNNVTGGSSNKYLKNFMDDLGEYL